MVSPSEMTLRRVLVGHRAAVNVVDFDDKYIVSASGDRTIKVWNTSSCEFVRTLNGHKRGIACLQYRDRLVVSGSSDNTIRYLLHINTKYCFVIVTTYYYDTLVSVNVSKFNCLLKMFGIHIMNLLPYLIGGRS